VSDAWLKATTVDPLADSDDEGDEFVRYEYSKPGAYHRLSDGLTNFGFSATASRHCWDSRNTLFRFRSAGPTSAVGVESPHVVSINYSFLLNSF
jgi:hypothetical protein